MILCLNINAYNGLWTRYMSHLIFLSKKDDVSWAMFNGRITLVIALTNVVHQGYLVRLLAHPCW